MRLRETNHLRKLANESGKQMRGPRRKKKVWQSPPEPICKNCGCRYSTHLDEWAKKNGTCDKFEAVEAG